jgi:hypothetical protein
LELILALFLLIFNKEELDELADIFGFDYPSEVTGWLESISLNYTTQFFENKDFKEEKEYLKTPIKLKVKPKKNNKTNIPYLVENFLKGKYGEKQYLLYKQNNHKDYSSEYQKTYNYFYYKQKKIQDKTIIPNKFNITKTDKILF